MRRVGLHFINALYGLPEAQRAKILFRHEHQLRREAGRIGDDLATEEGVLPAEPIAVPARRQLAARRAAELLSEPVGQLIEKPVETGIRVQLSA